MIRGRPYVEAVDGIPLFLAGSKVLELGDVEDEPLDELGELVGPGLGAGHHHDAGVGIAEYKSNVIGLARIIKALKMPVLISSSNAQWQNGDTLPEIKELFPEQPVYRRTGIINAYEDPTFRKAFDELIKTTGRTHVIIAGVTIGTCCSLPTLSMFWVFT